MDFWVFIIIAVVVALIVGVFQGLSQNAKANNLQAYIRGLDEFKSAVSFLSADQKKGLAIDDECKQLCIVNKAGESCNPKIFKLEDILSSEILENGQVLSKSVRSSQIGGALIGGLALGGVGAIIGGLSGSKKDVKKVKDMQLRIIVNDVRDPINDICFLNVETKNEGFIYEGAKKLIEEWHAKVKVMINLADKHDNENKPPSQVEENNQPSIADEIAKLLSLKESGAISDDEFKSLKKKLIAPDQN